MSPGPQAPTRAETIAAVLDACDGHQGRILSNDESLSAALMHALLDSAAPLALPPRFCREPGDKCPKCWGDGWWWIADDETAVLQEDADEGEPHSTRQELCPACQGTGSARRAGYAPRLVCPCCAVRKLWLADGDEVQWNGERLTVKRCLNCGWAGVIMETAT